ncbi:hypothetical protein [Kumtagia ephedrae]|uniref:Uncharacterized protein n=1 Tax=Kumtagia ephedrae TaxID=2116701 RepID=A0A2P7SJE6_9HYPH|nr:hypothetical protein [Mesorhizobium ephedrae]PSJ62471.1 hypothetical protein C7I84_07620 [Mesorhizobium ephedrae]
MDAQKKPVDEQKSVEEHGNAEELRQAAKAEAATPAAEGEIAPAAEAESIAATEADAVSEGQFEEIAVQALEGVGGTILFRMRIDGGAESQHVAAGAVGDGEARQFLILSMPTAGGELRVEPAGDSDNPVAGIAASYAGLADVFAAAA